MKKVNKKKAAKKVTKKVEKRTPKTTPEERAEMRERANRYYRQQRARGLTRIGVWVHPDDSEAVHNYARKKVKARGV